MKHKLGPQQWLEEATCKLAAWIMNMHQYKFLHSYFCFPFGMSWTYDQYLLVPFWVWKLSSSVLLSQLSIAVSVWIHTTCIQIQVEILRFVRLVPVWPWRNLLSHQAKKLLLVACYGVLLRVMACCVLLRAAWCCVLRDDEFSQCFLTLLKNGSFAPLLLKVLLQLCIADSQSPSEDATK